MGLVHTSYCFALKRFTHQTLLWATVVAIGIMVFCEAAFASEKKIGELTR